MKTFSDFNIQVNGVGEQSALCPECSRKGRKKRPNVFL